MPSSIADVLLNTFKHLLDMKRTNEDAVVLLCALQIKLGVKGAEELGEYEVWFNYRLSRAAPETCADFLGSFVADRASRQFSAGGKWLVWKFEVR